MTSQSLLTSLSPKTPFPSHSFLNPESSPTLPRSLSPNTYQYYKHCINQIHSQHHLSPNTPLSSSSKFKKTTRVDESNVDVNKEELEQVIKSNCSIDDRLQIKQLKITEQQIEEIIQHTITIYQIKLQQLQTYHHISIHQLQTKLTLLTQTISQKQHQILSLTQSYQQKLLQQSKLQTMQTRYHPVLESRMQYNIMKETLDGLGKRCRDIQKRIRIVGEWKGNVDGKENRRVQEMIERVEREAIVEYGERVRKVERVIEKWQEKIKQLEIQIHKIREQNTTQSTECKTLPLKQFSLQQDKTSFVGINVKIVQIKQQLISSQLSLKSIPDIFKMYCTEYQQLFYELREKIRREQERNGLEKSIFVESEQDVIEKRGNNYSMVTPLFPTQSLHASPIPSSPKHQIKPLSLSRSTFSLSPKPSLTLSRNVSDIHKLQRLIQTFKILNHHIPLKCSIDQTGYLKYADSGTYIFDRYGNTFELNEEEIGIVREMGMVLIEE